MIEATRGGEGTPFLGICLGLQLLFERGDEGVPADAPTVLAPDPRGTGLDAGSIFEADGTHWVRGLAVLPGSCTRLESARLKVPHVGWDQVHLTGHGRPCPLLEGLAEGSNVYFTHSYALGADVDEDDVAGVTHYARNFASVVAHGSVFGCQFHPEKSSAHGHAILRNFVRLCS